MLGLARGCTISKWKNESSSISMKDDDDDEDVAWSGGEKGPSKGPVQYRMKEIAERRMGK